MSLSVIPLTILGQITGVSGSGDTVLYQVSFKSIDGTPLYGVTAVWTDEQAEIEALAAQKPYGVWINPINGTFAVKFAGYTYVGSADLTDPDVLAGITPIEFVNQSGIATEPIIFHGPPAEFRNIIESTLASSMPTVISANGKFIMLPTAAWYKESAVDKDGYEKLASDIADISARTGVNAYTEKGNLITIKRITDSHKVIGSIIYDYVVSTYHFIMSFTYDLYHDGSLISYTAIAALMGTTS